MPPKTAPVEAPGTIALPLPIQRALAHIAAELADMPRECARDHAALCLWKGRLARRIRGVLTMRVPMPAQGPSSAATVSEPSVVIARRPAQANVGGRGVLIRMDVRQLELGL